MLDVGNNGTCWVPAHASQTVSYSGGGVVVAPTILNSASLGFTIDKGALSTNSPVLTIDLNADPKIVTGYALSLDPSFAGSGIESYINTVTTGTIQLPNKSGTYTVYLKYFSPTGARSAALSHSVVYDPSGTQTVSTGGDTNSVDPFIRNLKLGSQGTDVTALQKLLVKDGDLVIPAGANYGRFGVLTQKALESFQVKYNIAAAGDQGYGIFGPKTRAEALQIL